MGMIYRNYTEIVNSLGFALTRKYTGYCQSFTLKKFLIMHQVICDMNYIGQEINWGSQLPIK